VESLDGTIASWNSAAERLFGFGHDEAVGSDMKIIVPPDRSDERLDIANELRNGRSIQNLETVRLARDGSLLEVSPATDLTRGGWIFQLVSQRPMAGL
jgi:PAS domain S-box-containing protein